MNKIRTFIELFTENIRFKRTPRRREQMKETDDRCPLCNEVVWLWVEKRWKNNRVYHKRCLRGVRE